MVNNTEGRKLQISKMLTVSSAHIKEETAQFLNDETRDELIVYPKLVYGWFILANPGTEDFEAELTRIPEELANLIRFAKENGCDWLCLDCDGDKVEGLPIFDW